MRKLITALATAALLVPAVGADAGHLRYLPQFGNDDFANATALSGDLPIQTTARLIGATVETDEPATSCDDSPTEGSVWYSFTAPATSAYQVDTYAPSGLDGPADTNVDIEVFTGTAIDALTEVTCDNTESEGTGDDTMVAAAFEGTAGTTYLIRLSEGTTGDPATTPLQIRQVADPANDDFADAVVAADGFDMTGFFGESDLETGEVVPSCGSAGDSTGSVWFRLTPPTTADWMVRSSASDGDVTTAVYTGSSVDALTEVECSSGGAVPISFGDSNGMNEILTLDGGTTYHVGIFVESTELHERQRWSLQLQQAVVPGNDDLVNATEITGPLSESLMLHATDVETDEQCGSDVSVWYTITPTEDDVLQVSTNRSDGDLQMGFYTGDPDEDAHGDLTQLDCFDSDSNFYAESHALDMTAGTTYYIQVTENSGNGLASVDIYFPETADNLTIGTAREITQFPFRDSAEVAEALEEAGGCNNDEKYLYWTWTAPFDMEVFVTTTNSLMDTHLTVFEGADLGADVLCSDDYGGSYASGGTFDATSGTTYTIGAGSLATNMYDNVGRLFLWVTGGGGVTGTVTDSDGDPLEGMCVSATQGTEDRGSVMTAADGTWAIAGLDDGDVDVEIGPCGSRAHVAGYETVVASATAVKGRTIVLEPTALNGTPVAVDDAATTTRDTEVEIDVLANDTDDAPGLTIGATTEPDNGSVDCDDTCTYTPAPGFSGEDTFTYTATDGDATSAPATVTVTVDPRAFDQRRFAGENREETPVLVSQFTFPNPGDADVVVLARSDTYPDALAGGPLAFAANGPILLTPPTALSPDAAGEIQRLGVDKVYLLGGPVALSQAVEDAVEALGVTTIERLAGADRFATAVLVADELADVNGAASDTAYVVEGQNASPSRGWPDAVSAGPAASLNGNPILLVTRDTVPGATATALADIDNAIVVGGEVAVSAATFGAVDAIVDTTTRVAGATRFSTSTAIADTQLASVPTPTRAWIATGFAFPDALAAGPAVAREGGVLALIDGTSATGETITWLTANSDDLDGLRILGGEVAISAGTAAAAVAAVQ